MCSKQVSSVYDQISLTYDQDCHDLVGGAQDKSLHLLHKHINGVSQLSIADIAVGTGSSFLKLEHILKDKNAQISWHGNDISPAMLERAKERVPFPFTPSCETAENLYRIIPESSQDIILAHFLYSYVDIPIVMQNAYRALKPGGLYCSLTSTEDSFYTIRTKARKLTSRLPKFLQYDEHYKNWQVPKSHQHHQDVLQELGFKITDADEYKHSFSLDTLKDWESLAIDQGWGAHFLMESEWVGKVVFLASKLLQTFSPSWWKIQDDIQASIVIAQKPLNEQ